MVTGFAGWAEPTTLFKVVSVQLSTDTAEQCWAVLLGTLMDINLLQFCKNKVELSFPSYFFKINFIEMRLWAFLLLWGSICIFPGDPSSLQISLPDCGLFSLIAWFFNKSLFSGGEPDVVAQAWHKPGVTHVWPAPVFSMMERNCLTIKQLSLGMTQEGRLPGEGQWKVVSSGDITAQIPKSIQEGACITFLKWETQTVEDR